MGRQNRVNPAGELIASPSKAATMIGNRGCLHNDRQEIVRDFKGRAWICCMKKYKDFKRPLMDPGLYTVLFFLDEVTALAAGHRPCFFCRRECAKLFSSLWAQANLNATSASVKAIDDRLHAERLSKCHQSVKSVQSLPNGTTVRSDRSGKFYALRNARAFPWTFDGYQASVAVDVLDEPLSVVTPPSIVRVLELGYPIEFHPSAPLINPALLSS